MDGSAPGAAADEEPVMELEHAVGYSGDVPHTLRYHPSEPNKYLYAAGSCIVVSDFDNPHDQLFFRGHDRSITCIALSPSGRVLASGQSGENSDILVWNFLGAAMMYRFSEHDHRINALAFSHDERLLASAGNDHKMAIWDIFTGMMVCSVPAQPDPTDLVTWGGMVKDIKRRDTALYQFATAGARQVYLWSLDPFTGEASAHRMASRTVRDYTSLEFTPNYEFLVAGTATGDVCCFLVKTRALVTSFAASRIGVGALRVDAGTIVVGGGDGTLSVWSYEFPEDDPPSVIERARSPAMSGGLQACAVARSGAEALAGTSSGAVYRVPLSGRSSELAPGLVAASHAGPVRDVAFAPGVSDRFATCGADASVRVWNASDYSVQCTAFVRDAGTPQCLAYTLDTLISGWTDGQIRCHVADATAAPLWSVPNAHHGGVTALAVARNMRFAVTGGMSGEVRLWELRTRELVSHLKEHSARVTAVALYDDDAHALSVARDKCLLCWDLRAEKRVSSHVQRMGGLNAVAVTRNQDTVVTAGQEKSLSFWDLRQPQPQRVTSGAHDEGEATCLAVSHNGRFLASGGTDNRVRLWDMASGALVCDGVGHSARVNSLRFAPDDKQVISVGEDGCIFVWNVYDD